MPRTYQLKSLTTAQTQPRPSRYQGEYDVSTGISYAYEQDQRNTRIERITITIEEDLLTEIDAAAKVRGYQNRSEIIRALARAGLQQSAEDADASGHAWQPWFTSTTTPRAISQNGWSRIFTAITTCRWRRCMFISMTTAAWK